MDFLNIELRTNRNFIRSEITKKANISRVVPVQLTAQRTFTKTEISILFLNFMIQ